METVKAVKKIVVDKNKAAEIIERVIKEKIDKGFVLLLSEIEKMLEKRWVFMENKTVFYDNEVSGFFPNLEEYEISKYSTKESCNHLKKEANRIYKPGNDFDWDIITFEEFKKTVCDSNFPYRDGSYIRFKCDSYKRVLYCLSKEDTRYGYVYNMDWNRTGYYYPIVPIYRLNLKHKKTPETVLYFWLKEGVVPKGLKNKETYNRLMKMLKKDEIEVKKCKISFNLDKIFKNLKDGVFALNKEVEYYIKKILLSGDKIRADIDEYDLKILTDPNRGHWDLYGQNAKLDENKVEITLSDVFYARNPLLDIKEGGIVGIDFGTKSTVVVFQNNSDLTRPMRISGRIEKEVKASDYENPTVMQFIDIKSFMEAYKLKKGRPETQWKTLTVSHTARAQLLENESSDVYYSVFSELKQWAGSSKRQVRIKDIKGKEITLSPFLDLKENDFNPIELYAYYIGLYINNMFNGIYLNYLLSFPVNYELEVKNKILESFRRGLTKSLPEVVIKERKIDVSFGASEPAAYAITALKEYKIEPTDNGIFYGVFDFGGGTTDFDFGVWREATKKDGRRYDFVIEHFGANGDKFLGGENLLELLAYEVFKDNLDKLRDKKNENIIPFSKPLDDFAKEFAGSEAFLNKSQEAKLNTKRLMEKLRPFWEESNEEEKEINENKPNNGKEKKEKKYFEEDNIKLNLYNKAGESKQNMELKVDENKLKNLLKTRISYGVKNFFHSLRLAVSENETENVDWQSVKIFLAGNSSKSTIVKELFDEEIKNMMEKIKEVVKLRPDDKVEFKVYPPLGTKDALKILKKEKNDIEAPTGKTGVAFGLLRGRKGGKIKVINRDVTSSSEAKLQYYIGENKRDKFIVLIKKDFDYYKWVNFIDASEDSFEIYYTHKPYATTNEMPIEEAKRKIVKIDEVDENKNVYIRITGPDKIEYIVSLPDEINNKKLKGEEIKLD